MEHIGAGLAALGVIGPGIGIGILARLADRGDRPQPRRRRRRSAASRSSWPASPKDSASWRSSSACSRSSSRHRTTGSLAWLYRGRPRPACPAGSPGAARPGDRAEINLFWVIVAAVNFIVFLLVIWRLFFTARLDPPREPAPAIEQGLRTPMRRARRATGRGGAPGASSSTPAGRRPTSSHEPSTSRKRRATRDMDATRAEIEHMREQATTDIDAENASARWRTSGRGRRPCTAGRRPGRRRDPDRAA